MYPIKCIPPLFNNLLQNEYNVSINSRLCCQCGTPIPPNKANMCVACLRTQVDISEGIPKQATLYYCKGCERWHLFTSTTPLATVITESIVSQIPSAARTVDQMFVRIPRVARSLSGETQRTQPGSIDRRRISVDRTSFQKNQSQTNHPSRSDRGSRLAASFCSGFHRQWPILQRLSSSGSPRLLESKRKWIWLTFLLKNTT